VKPECGSLTSTPTPTVTPASTSASPQLTHAAAQVVRRRHHTGQPPATYILKPDAGAMGRGILLVQTEAQVRRECLMDTKLALVRVLGWGGPGA
jgi:hypothetical protein